MVSAVFLVLVLSLLGAMIVNLSNANQVGHARDLVGTRAYYAARAGIEWGAYRALQAGSCVATSTLPALAGSSAGFAVTVACAASGPFDEAGNSVMVYQITANARRGTLGALDYAEREVVAIFSAP